jgi:hypothetical protein
LDTSTVALEVAGDMVTVALGSYNVLLSLAHASGLSPNCSRHVAGEELREQELDALTVADVLPPHDAIAAAATIAKITPRRARITAPRVERAGAMCTRRLLCPPLRSDAAAA